MIFIVSIFKITPYLNYHFKDTLNENKIFQLNLVVGQMNGKEYIALKFGVVRFVFA